MRKKLSTKQWRFSLVYLLWAVLAIWYLRTAVSPPQPRDLSYSEFLAEVKAGHLEDVRITERQLIGTLKKDAVKDKKTPPNPKIQCTRIPGLDAGPLVQELEGQKVRFSGTIPQSSAWADFLISWGPFLLLFGIYFVAMRKMQKGGGPLSFGRNRAKIHDESERFETKFSDVAGVEEAKAELAEIIDFLKTPQTYQKLGGRIPRGELLVGPPGTGKTLLARAVAGEAGVPFFSISGSEFVEMFVGVGAARVRDLFEQAREKAPAIIFIDELDALGRARGAYPYAGGNDEKEQTLNQLLVELDGFDPRTGLVLLAATNRPEILDPALLRAGRFDRQILVDRPDRRDRLEILAVHLKKIRAGHDVDPEKLAELTAGFTGADIANLVNEAALIATRRGAEAVQMQDFTAASERIIAGLEKRNRVLSPAERKIVAYHEMGHALVALSLPGTDRVHKVSIIPRGIGSLGYTIQRPTEELENKMAVLLGGRAAERLVFGTVSTGAADDLQKVTDIARSMVMRYGMAEELGPVTYEAEPRAAIPSHPGLEARPYSESTARRIDALVQQLVARVFDRTLSLLRSRRRALENGAAALLARETLSEEELIALLGSADGAPEDRPAPLQPDDVRRPRLAAIGNS